jgi:2'-5' RNA ligase
MTRLAIVSYPRLEDAGRGWVESVRKRHDPQASLIAAHFTLVFPVDIDVSRVVAHAAQIAAAAAPIHVVLRRAEAVRDEIQGSGGHVFLVPDEGRAEIASLHDRLYEGALKQHRRGDVPFVPHLTVAADAQYERCEALVHELNAAPLSIRGTLDAIEVIEVAAGEIRCLMKIFFGEAGK